MDLAKLQEAVERAPVAVKACAKEILALQNKARTIEYFQEAVRLMRVSWKDADPGKHAAHWYAFKDGQKAWPRELVDTVAVAKHDTERHARYPDWKDYAVPLAVFAELDRQPCPSCQAQGLVVGRYEQIEDTPSGDQWVKARYVMCADCRGLYSLDDSRFSPERF